MEPIYVFFIRNDVWIYILSALGLLWFGTELLRTAGTARRAVFGLERETALRARNRALLIVLALLAIVLTVTYVNREIAPSLPPSLLKPPTPTPDPLSLPAAPLPGTVEAEATPTSPVAAPTVTLPGGAAAVATETPESVQDTSGTSTPQSEPTLPVRVSGCAPAANIVEPRNGALVAGILNVFGNARTADFGYYELEISGPQTNGRWASLLGRRITQTVDDGFLGGNINLTQWEPGSYLVRLTVVNSDGNTTHQCAVDIVLDNS
ncbi:MAG: hypothetical protein RRC07_05670 [Anaerolineae bacterium]|nr:hypothetical protein [Anaerolineae bacterium]